MEVLLACLPTATHRIITIHRLLQVHTTNMEHYLVTLVPHLQQPPLHQAQWQLLPAKLPLLMVAAALVLHIITLMLSITLLLVLVVIMVVNHLGLLLLLALLRLQVQLLILVIMVQLQLVARMIYCHNKAHNLKIHTAKASPTMVHNNHLAVVKVMAARQVAKITQEVVKEQQFPIIRALIIPITI
jgi:hypothetical protein